MSELTAGRRRSGAQLKNDKNSIQVFFQHWGIGFTVGFVCYAFLFINQLTNQYDGIWHGSFYAAGDWELSIGRWFLGLFSVLRGGFAGDPLNSLLTIAAISLANTMIAALFHMLNSRSSHLYAAMIMCSTTVCSFLSYRFMSPVFGFSYLLSVSGIYSLKRIRKTVIGFCLAVVCICISLAMYQAEIGCVCLLVLFLAAKECIDDKKKKTSPFKTLFIGGLAAASACLIYYIVWKILLKANGVTPSSYKGAENVSLSGILLNLPASMASTYKEFAAFFTRNELLQNVFQAKPLGYILLAVLLTALFVCVLCTMRKGVLSGAVLTACICLIPVACNFYLLLVPGNKLDIQMTASLCMVIPLTLMFVESAFKTLLAGKSGRIGQSILLGTAMLMLYGNISQTSIDMNVMYEGRKATETLVQNIMSSAIQSDLYKENRPIVFVGLPCESPTYQKSALWQECNQYARFGQWWEGANSQRSYQGILKRLGIQAIVYGIDGSDSYTPFMQKNNDAILAMPLYPQAGSMAIVDHALVVKVSNAIYAAEDWKQQNIERLPLLEVWYEMGAVGYQSILHVTTRPDIDYIKVVNGEEELGLWSADQVQIIDYPAHGCKEWAIPCKFDRADKYELVYHTSYDGIHFIEEETSFPIEIDMPYISAVHYEQCYNGEQTAITVMTREDIDYLELLLGENELGSWRAADAVVAHDEERGTKEWRLEYVFEHPGIYDLWYRASCDGTEYYPYSPGFENAINVLYKENAGE